jgi:hypothetical protein
MKPFLAAVAALALASQTLAGFPSLSAAPPCCYEALFRQGALGCDPLGPTSGAVLYVDGKYPRLKAHLQGVVWKGKTFHGDGTFTNRWLCGVRAVSAGVCVAPSWLDGQPCFVMQYAPDAAVFGNVRDELREIAPDVWLGRSYNAATGHPKNWFVLFGK